MNKLYLLLSIIQINSIFVYKNTSSKECEKISLVKEEKQIKNEALFYYKVKPVIYKDSILYSAYYVLGNDMYYSPITDESVSIEHNVTEQYIKVTCLKPFDKRIIIKLFSAHRNYVYSMIVIDYKQKFTLSNAYLMINDDATNFYIKPNLSVGIGSKKINSEIKYNDIKYEQDFITNTKNRMKEKAEEKISLLADRNDISFEHTFIGFDNNFLVTMFSSSTERVFSFFEDIVSYSYFDFDKNKLITNEIIYGVYDLLKYDFYYQNKVLFNISYSIDNQNFKGSFSL